MAISVGSVEVDVVPNTRGIYGKLKTALVPAANRAGQDAGNAAGRAMQAAMADAGVRIGNQVGSQIAQRISVHVRGALRDGITQGGAAARPAATRQGEETAGAFARSMRARLEAAFRSMPRLDVRLSDTGVDADLARLRARLEALAGKQIGIDVSAEAARAEVTDIDERLRRLGAYHPNVAVRADTARARAELSAMREEIDRISADPARIRVETDGQFGQRLRAAVQQAEASLPNINIDANTSDAQARLASLRASLTALSDQRIGIDIDAAAATARITELQGQLERLSTSDADVAVRVDAAAAAAQLAGVQAMVSRLDGQTARIDVDTSAAKSAIFQLSIALASVAAIPAIPILGAGIGAIGSAAVAAGAGVGALAAVAIPAFSGIKSALDAQKQAQNAATTATAKGGQAAAQAAQRALQMAGAQQSLAAAERNGARQIAQAQAQVRQAKQAAADAATQAAQRQQQAARAVQDAERSLAAAQRDARQAQDDLAAARRQAAEDLVDLANRAADAQLSQRDAALSLREAKADLQRVQADASASDLDRDRAQLAYDQAVQRLKEQRLETKRLQTEKAKADKTGVAGTDRVRSAQERLAQAQRTVADRARAVRDAQAEAVRVQTQTARQVAAAQERVGAAIENVAVAQQSAADAVASAQRQIKAAQLSAAGGANQAATAQAKYRAALAKLSPAARGTFDAFTRLRTAFKAWSLSLQPKVMPIFTRALDGIRHSLPGLTPFVTAAADAIGKLQDRVSKGFKSPWWKSFKKDLAGSVKPAIIGIGISFGRIFKGMAGIVQAFLPHMDDISRTMQRITGRFAKWGKSLKGSPAFEDFLDYASKMGPKVASFIGDIADGFFKVAHALSPLSGPVLSTLGALARAVGSIADTLPWLIQGIYLVIIAVKLWTIATAIFNAVMALNPITLIIIAIVALVAAVIYAYKHFDWFRTAVQVAWDWIKKASLWAWNKVLKPVFNFIGKIVMWLWNKIIKPYFKFIVAYWKMVGRIAMWLWHKVISPVFSAIAKIFTWLYRNVVKPVFNAIVAVVKFFWKVAEAIFLTAVAFVRNVLAPIFRWLYNHTVKPVFNAIKKVIKLTWLGVKIVFNAIVGFLRKTLGPIFRWLYDKVIKPVWDAIKKTISWVWNHGIKPAFDAVKKGVSAIGTAFERAKDAIKKAWDKLKNIAKVPVNFIINTVYTKGIKKVWDKVVGAFGGKKLPAVHGLATGGVLPGYTPGKDVHRFVSSSGGALDLSGGEAIMRPEWTRGVGAGFVGFMNRIARTRGVAGVRQAMSGMAGGRRQAFKGGGIFEGIGDLASSAWDKIKDGASWLKDTFGGAIKSGVKAVVNPLIDLIPGDSGFVGMLKDGARNMVDLLLGGGKKGDKLATPRVKYNPSAGVEQWRSVVLHALRLVHQPASLANTTLRRMQQESGGNPTIVNRWDSNWKAGHPSVGLMQVIRGTFRAYAGRYRNKGPFSYGVSVDPLANIFASMRYAMSRYGSLSKAYNRPGGYDSGGYLQPGWNLAYNGTGRPEPVFTTAQANALMRMAAPAQEPRGGDGASVSYVINARTADFTVRDLQTVQRRQEARARVGRPR